MDNNNNQEEKSNAVQEILFTAGANIGRSREDMKPIIKKIVVENWIDTQEALLLLTPNQWKDLQIPIRLVNEIQGVLSKSLPSQPSPVLSIVLDENEQEQSRLSSKSTFSETSKKEQKNAEEDLREVSFDPPDATSLPFSLVSVTPLLCRFIGSHSDVITSTTLTTLLKMVDSILRDPEDATKRRVRLENRTFHSRIGQYPEALNFLKAAGFQEAGPYLDLPVAYISRLTDCRQLLSSIMIENGIEVPELRLTGFNPYQSNIFISNPQLAPLIEPGPVNSCYKIRLAQNAAINDEIRKTEVQLKTGGIASSIPLSPQVFHLSTLGKLDETVNQVNDDFDYDCMNDHSIGLSQEEMRRIKQTIGEGPQFKSRAKERLEQLQKRKIHSKCILRIQFPDRFVLQLEFAPATKMSDVNAAIDQFLDSKLEGHEWHIYQSPPRRTFDPKKTLFDENLVPGAMVYFKVDSENPPVAPYIISHLLPAALPEALPSSSVSTTGAAIADSSGSSNSNSPLPVINLRATPLRPLGDNMPPTLM